MADAHSPPGHLGQQALESYLWGAANLLRGLIDAGDYKQYVFPLLFFKRLSDVWDEDYRNAFKETSDRGYSEATANDRFIIPDGAHWSDVRATARDVGRTLRTAFRAIEAANPERLVGVFGNAPWTDKAQMPDATLKNLIEHFSTHTLSLAAVPEDELGNAYEYLVKQFADDSGHTAQEFYTNRTLVHLMTQMLRPRPGERIYDPTAGTGGMLISALAEVRRNGGDARTLRLYGQEIIGTTASIARMNLVLHGVEDFRIAVGNALSEPAFIERDRLMTFDVILANPPYSIKAWNRDAWLDDPWGRNILARIILDVVESVAGRALIVERERCAVAARDRWQRGGAAWRGCGAYEAPDADSFADRASAWIPELRAKRRRGATRRAPGVRGRFGATRRGRASPAADAQRGAGRSGRRGRRA